MALNLAGIVANARLNLAGIVANARLIAADYRFDSCSIIRPVNTPDDAGGWTTVEGVVESGTCILTPGATRPEEKVIADRAGATAPITLRNIPYNTLLTASDVVVVGSRRLEVLGVLKAEAVNVAVTAVCEERS